MAKQKSSLIHDVYCWIKALYADIKDYLVTALVYSALFGAIIWILLKMLDLFLTGLRESLKI